MSRIVCSFMDYTLERLGSLACRLGWHNGTCVNELRVPRCRR